MQLGVVIGTLNRGGTETQLAQVLPQLVKRGFEVSVFVLSALGPMADELRCGGVLIRHPTLPNMFQSLPRRFSKYIVFIYTMLNLFLFSFEHRKGILHFYLPHAVILGGLLSIWWHPRVVISQRGLLNYRHKYSGLAAKLERFAFRKARAVLVNSKAVGRTLREDGLARDDITLIYNGVAPERLDPPQAQRMNVRAELGIGADEWALVILANLHPYKGHADVLAALGLLEKAAALPKAWRLLLIGRDVDNQFLQLRAMAAELQIEDHLLFLGERSDVPRLLRAADIGILPSHEEGFSNALLEMMGAGLAIIATEVGGNNEALNGGECGLLVPPRDPPALADAILHLKDRRLCAALGAKARCRVEAEFSLETCVQRHLAFYQNLMSRQELDQLNLNNVANKKRN
jgi:glycosyltransferase involved in cell wall biosynthesis